VSTIPSAIYLDHAATTPVRPEVAEAMSALLAEDFGNPSSGHAWGRRARGRLEAARASVAASLGVTSDRVLFTRGGTESDNLAVLGRIRHDLALGVTPHVVTSAVEHPAVLEASVIGVLGALLIPLVHVSVLWFPSLHPQPVVLNVEEGPTLDGDMLITLMIGLLAFTLIFFSVFCLRYGLEHMRYQRALEAREQPRAA